MSLYKRFSRYGKYQNKRTQVGGVLLDSKAEAKDYRALLIMQKAGKIRDLQLQVRIPLFLNIKNSRFAYVADFVYFDVNLQQRVVFDTKGYELAAFKLKRAAVLDTYKGFIFITKYKDKVRTDIPVGALDLMQFLKKDTK